MKTEPTTGSVARPRRPQRAFSAKEKSQAVLSLWSGRRSAAALMKELDIPWGTLNIWEQRAIGGVLTALDPGWQQTPETSLPARVEKLITQTMVLPQRNTEQASN